MKDKIVIATIASNTDYYYICSKNLIDNFLDDDDFILFVYTDNENEFIGYNNLNIITHKHDTHFKYHDKFVYINEIRKLGYQKICYIDADMYLADKKFLKNIKSHKFNPGLTCTRYTSIDFKSLLMTNPKLDKFKSELIKQDVFFKNAMSPWEDLLFFDFEYFTSEKIDSLFDSFEKYRKMREKHAIQSGDDLRGEGAIFGLTAMNEEFPINASHFLYKQLNYFRDNHLPKYEDMESISVEGGFVILVKKENDYRKTLDVTYKFYQQHFNKSDFIIVEINDEETLKNDVENMYSSKYLFINSNDVNSLHLAIIKSIKMLKNKTFIMIENGSILLDCRNVQNNVELVLRGLYDYIVPFTNRYELPYIKLTENNYSSIFVCNKEIFLHEFENCPWNSSLEIHEKLIEKYKFKSTPNDLLILDNNDAKPMSKIS